MLCNPWKEIKHIIFIIYSMLYKGIGSVKLIFMVWKEDGFHASAPLLLSRKLEVILLLYLLSPGVPAVKGGFSCIIDKGQSLCKKFWRIKAYVRFHLFQLAALFHVNSWSIWFYKPHYGRVTIADRSSFYSNPSRKLLHDKSWWQCWPNKPLFGNGLLYVILTA